MERYDFSFGRYFLHGGLWDQEKINDKYYFLGGGKLSAIMSVQASKHLSTNIILFLGCVGNFLQTLSVGAELLHLAC